MMVVNFVLEVVVQWLIDTVVGGGIVCGDCEGVSTGGDLREVMMTSPPELDHCGGRG